MVRDRPSERAEPPGTGGEVDRDGRRRRPGRVPARAAVRVAGGGGAAAHRDGRALRAGGARLRAPPDDVVRAAYTSAWLAQIDEVGTLEARAARRLSGRRGSDAATHTHNTAQTPRPALRPSSSTDAADWPQQLYAASPPSRSASYDFLKLPCGERPAIIGVVGAHTLHSPGRPHGRGADPGLHERRGAAPYPRDRRDVVLVALARELWHKGATSGNVQRLRALRYDCDDDALVALVEPAGPACHTGERTCFYRGDMDAEPAEALPALERTSRSGAPPTRRRATPPRCWPSRHDRRQGRGGGRGGRARGARGGGRARGRGGRGRAVPPDRAARLARPCARRRLRGAQ